MPCFCQKRNTEVKIFYVRDLTYSKGLLRKPPVQIMKPWHAYCWISVLVIIVPLIKADLETCSVWPHCVAEVWWIKGFRLKNQLHSTKCLFLHYCNYWPFTRIKGVLHYFHTFTGPPFYVCCTETLLNIRGGQHSANHRQTFLMLCLKIIAIHQRIGNRYYKEIGA